MAIEKIVIFHHDGTGAVRTWSERGELVRCVNCNKSEEWANGRWCRFFRASVNADSYCSFGAKRKEGREK